MLRQEMCRNIRKKGHTNFKLGGSMKYRHIEYTVSVSDKHRKAG